MFFHNFYFCSFVVFCLVIFGHVGLMRVFNSCEKDLQLFRLWAIFWGKISS